MMKARLVALLKDGNGIFWREERNGRSIRYFSTVLKSENRSENNRTGVPSQGVGSCSRTAEQPNGKIDKLCAIHNFHNDWILVGGIYVCLRCQPEVVH